MRGKMHPSGIVPQIQNVFCSAMLGCELDLQHIVVHAPNAEYNPKKSPAVIMRIRELKATVQLYATGNLICAGATSEEDARKAARKCAKIVAKLGFPVTFKQFKVDNIMASCNVNFPTRLEAMAVGHRSVTKFEPEMFPGLNYTMLSPKVQLTIFASGTVNIIGAQNRADIYKAFENIYPILYTYRKGDAPPAAPLAALPPPAAPVTSDEAGSSGGSTEDQEVEEELPGLPPPSPS